MSFPITPPIEPMLSKAAAKLPDAEGVCYEPKWDGFRAIVFRGASELYIQSRELKPLDRYFPELHDALLAVLPPGCVVDGEIVIASPDGLDFDALQMRLHPAASRVQKLALEMPASFVAFDLLALDDRSLIDAPLHERHALLRSVLSDAGRQVYLCPSTTDHEIAQHWFVEFEGAGLDGVVAKRLADPYTPDKRTLVKVKHLRTADCVVAGYRIHKDGKGVGSLLLGLFDGDGVLHHVGVAASFTAKRRAELLVELEPLTHDAIEAHPWREWAQYMAEAAGDQRMPGGGSRWNAGKDLSWVPLRIELVAEVTFGQLQEGRFRHGSTFLHWRPDREPASCTYDQLEVAAPVPFARLVERP
jgi:ATP-dependent DNA ligase